MERSSTPKGLTNTLQSCWNLLKGALRLPRSPRKPSCQIEDLRDPLMLKDDWRHERRLGSQIPTSPSFENPKKWHTKNWIGFALMCVCKGKMGGGGGGLATVVMSTVLPAANRASRTALLVWLSWDIKCGCPATSTMWTLPSFSSQSCNQGSTP